MKNKTHFNWLWQGLMAAALFVSIGLNQAHATSPFQEGDFVRIRELGDLEVQKNEITYAQYTALVALLPVSNQNPWKAQDCDIADSITRRDFGPNYPADCISFQDAEAYIRVLNAQDPSYSYRLPTDDELKTLADLTLESLRFNGTISEERLSRHFWYSTSRANEVCTKEPVLGLCDILGNLWELTSTIYGSAGRYLRGVAFTWNAGHVRAAAGFRSAVGSNRSATVGFRLVRIAKAENQSVGN